MWWTSVYHRFFIRWFWIQQLFSWRRIFSVKVPREVFVLSLDFWVCTHIYKWKLFLIGLVLEWLVIFYFVCFIFIITIKYFYNSLFEAITFDRHISFCSFFQNLLSQSVNRFMTLICSDSRDAFTNIRSHVFSLKLYSVPKHLPSNFSNNIYEYLLNWSW